MPDREDELPPPEEEERRARRRDILELAGRTPAGVTPTGEDPVFIARQVIELLLRLMALVPQLAPIIRRFLSELSRAGGGVAPTMRGPVRRTARRPVGPPPPEVPPV